jgi:multicomponent Na+:H+ antiporter subunit D
METVHSFAPFAAVLAPLVGAALILLTGRKRANLRESWTILAALAQFLFVYSMLPPVLRGNEVTFTIVEIYRGLALQLRVDAFGMIFALLASSLWIVVSIYSIGYMRSLKEHAQTRFYFCFALALFGAVGVAFSGNLITLYMFYEILTISTFPLVAHKETPEAIKAGRKYLAYLLGGAVLVLLAMAMSFDLAGTLDFSPQGTLVGKGSQGELRLILALFIIGFGTKAAIMPLHEWLPSAMIAPTPVSALLHAVAVVKAGVFCCVRVILYIFGPNAFPGPDVWLFLAYVVSITIILANVIAITQDNLKRRLAFSTINNLSVIILGACLLSPAALKGAFLHLPFHGFLKITLFMCAGAIYVKTRKELISEMGGIGRQMPVTMAAFAIGASGLVGIPPVCGFISKWYLCGGALKAGELLFLFVFLASAFLDAAYFFPIVYSAFFQGKAGRVDEAPLTMTLPIAGCAAASLFLGVFPDLFWRFFSLTNIVVQALSGGN